MTHVTGGFYNWQESRNGVRFRWTRARAMFYVPSTVREIAVPIGGPLPGFSAGRTTVRFSLDGRVVNQVVLEENEWVKVRMLIPEARGVRFRRIELDVSPTWTPVDDRNKPERARHIAGVRVGEVQMIDGE